MRGERRITFFSQALGIKLQRGADGLVRVIEVKPNGPHHHHEGDVCVGDVLREVRGIVDLRRTPNKHMSFGQGGPHVCLGMHLARLEVKILFQELSKRVKAIEPAGEHRFLRSNFVGGIKHLPVSVTLN